MSRPTVHAPAPALVLRVLAVGLFLGGGRSAHARSVEEVLGEAFYAYEATVGPVAIRDKTLVEGSVGHRGVQPHIFVDLDHPALGPLLALADGLRSSPLPSERKIELLRRAVRKALPVSEPHKRWHDLLARRHLERRGDVISLGDAVANKAGVCREHSLLMNVLLQRAGFDAKRHYVRVWYETPRRRTTTDHGFNTVLVNGRERIVDSYFDAFHGRTIAEARAKEGLVSRGLAGRPTAATGILELYKDPQRFRTYLPRSIAPAVGVRFQLPRRGQSPVTTEVLGRSTASRLFQAEQRAFEQARPDDWVEAEWIFSPYNLPDGHSALRVGKRLFEFGLHGWQVHEGGEDSAAAYLFSNPFFKGQHANYRRAGMPPFAIAVPVKLRRRDVEEGERRIREDPWRPFSGSTNNCNQALLKAFPALLDSHAGFLATRWPVFALRRLVQSAAQGLRLYPLPGVGDHLSAPSLKDLVPRYVAGPHSILAELFRQVRFDLARAVVERRKAAVGRRAGLAPRVGP